MLKLKDNVDIKELEKFGFEILVTDKKLYKRSKKDLLNVYCTMATKKLNEYWKLDIENDEYYRQLVLVPTKNVPFRLCVGWCLDTIYDLIKADIVEKTEED